MMIKKNDIISLEIEDMSVRGEGIGHYEGMTFFIPGAVTKDVITAGVTKLKKTYGYARLVSIDKPSIHRVEEECPVAKKCGGCALQAVSYDYQLELKEKRVREDLIRIGGFSPELVDSVMKPIVSDREHVLRYRNKAQFPVSEDKDGETLIGFYAPHSHRIVPIDDCLLLHPVNEKIISAIRGYMRDNNVSPYDEETGKGLIRHILTRVGFNSGQIMVCIVINGYELPHADLLWEKLSGIPGMTSFSININTKRANAILSDNTKTLFGQDTIEDTIGEVRFKISPNSFYQVNPYTTKLLYDKALSYAALTGNETVFDLYCGIGTISLFLAGNAKHVIGVEVVPQAIEDARENALLNGIENAKFITGTAEQVLSDWTGALAAGDSPDERTRECVGIISRGPDVIVVDPPRKGLDPTCVEAMLKFAPKRIVYVSCDPATLARDLKLLCDGGYEIKEVTPFDQFPNSNHTECCSVLTK